MFSILFATVGAAAQEMITVSGVVMEKDGLKEPIVGVSVAVKENGKNKYGVVTNVEGKFSISIPNGSVLHLSCMGYKPTTQKVNKSQSNLIIYMEGDSKVLDEVVTVGYVRRHKADVTSAVTVIKADELTKAPVSNVVELLQGRVAGLDIQLNNGSPGAIGNISMRGISDITINEADGDYYLNSSTPLFVIDGIPQEDVEEFNSQGLLAGSGISPLSSIPFEDIADIQVLKDAAATSLYGSKGAYGVILITTKKGDSPKPRVNYSMDVKVNTPPRLRDVIVGRDERLFRIRQILENDTTSYHGYNTIHDNQVLTDSLNPYFNNHTDWQDNFYRTTWNQTHNIAVSGGQNKFNYKINGNYYTEDGILKNTSFDRYGLRTGMGYNPNDRLSINVSVNATLTKQGVGSGNGLSQKGVASGSTASSLLPPPSMYSASSEALAGLVMETDVTATSYDASANVTYKFPFGLRLSSVVGIKSGNTETSQFTPAILNSTKAKVYGVTNNSSSIYARVGAGYSGGFELFTLPINYSFDVGVEYSQKKKNGNVIELIGLPSDYIQGPLSYSESKGTASVSDDDKTFAVSFVPSIRIRGGKYVFNPSLRPEANSAYGKKTKWVINPGLGLGWNYYMEPFAKDWHWLNRGAIRLTWGRTTKYRANRYDVWGSYLMADYTYNGETVTPIDFSNLPNNNLDPVTSTSWNIGTDMTVLNGLLRFDINAYYKQVDNQLHDIQLPDHNAFTKMKSTEVSLVNYGLEVEVGVRPIQKKDFSVNCNFNFSLKKDVVAKLPNEARQIINSGASVVNVLGGNALGNFLYINKGVYATDEDVPVDPATGLRLRVGGQSASNPDAYFRAGDPIWVDLNGDYVIDENDKMLIGNSQPRVTGGLSINVRYKNFSLFTSCSFVAKRDIINKVLADNFRSYNNPNISISQLASGAALLPISSYDFWTKDNTDAVYPNPYDYHRSKIIDPFRPDQTLFMEDGSYFKINGITLQYEFPKAVTRFFHIRSASIRCNVSNLYTFSKYSGINPESVNSLGWDVSGGYPNARSYSMGLNINL